MDPILLISVIALCIGIYNTIWLIINFILSKAPVLDYHFLESIRPKEARFYLSNIGEVKGKLTDLKIFDPFNNIFVHILFKSDLQNLYPHQRTNRDFYFKYNFLCEKVNSQWIDLRFKATIKLKILFLSKKFIYPRVYTVKCEEN